MRGVVLIVLLRTAVGTAAPAANEPGAKGPQRQRADGWTTILNNDVDRARGIAQRFALCRLVAQGLSAPQHRELTELFSIAEILIDPQASAIVKNMAIVSEKKDGDVVWVTVEGEPDVAAVEKALREVILVYARPNVRLEFAKRLPGVSDFDRSAVEVQLADKLLAAGFEHFIPPRLRSSVPVTPPRPPSETIVLHITAIVSDQSKQLRTYAKHMNSLQALITVKLSDARTGKTFGGRSESASAVHINTAAASQMAVKHCVNRLFDMKPYPDHDEKTDPRKSRLIRSIEKHYLAEAAYRAKEALRSGK